MSAVKAEPRPPGPALVNGRPVRFRLLQQVIASAIIANIGALIIAGLYFAVTQVDYHVSAHLIGSWPARRIEIGSLKATWDHLLPWHWWPVYRHGLRDLYEPILATLFVKSVVAKVKTGSEQRLGALALAVRAAAVFVVALPLVITGLYVARFGAPWLWHRAFGHAHASAPAFPHSLAWLGTYLASWPWQLLLIGALIGQVIHRIYAPAGATVQLFFIERQVVKARASADAGMDAPRAAARRYRPRWPLPPTVRERYWHIIETGVPAEAHDVNLRIAVWVFSAAAFALLVVGALARYWFAKGH